MTTLLEGIAEKYQDNETDYGFIVFVSNSPECKKGMFPPIMSLCDRALDQVGTNGILLSKLNHVCELDLSENNFSKWSEVLRILDIFPSLTFLNLAKNQLLDPLFISDEEQSKRRQLPLRKLVLNNNKVGWESLQSLTKAMPFLEEVHLSNNSLENPGDGQFGHQNIQTMFLSTNLIDNFESVQKFLGSSCPNLETLNLAECPLSGVPKIIPNGATNAGLGRLVALNVNQTKISTWEDVDNFRTFPSLNELRIRNCPLTDEYTAHERRSLLVARLPNIQIFNGGDKVPANEREDAERAFIRYYMDEEEKPKRYHELVLVHGELDPLINVNLKPDTHVKVTISMGEEQTREETISVYLTVREFKTQLSQWFQIPVQNMRLYYCDQDLVQMAGPEEMKFPNKALYTFNVTNGDSFIVDEKKPLSKIKISGNGKFEATSPKIYGTSPSFPSSSKLGVTFAAINPKTFVNSGSSMNKAKRSQMAGPASVARNLFGSPPSGEANNNVENRETKNHSAGT